MVSSLVAGIFGGVLPVFPPTHVADADIDPRTKASWFRIAACQSALLLPVVLSQAETSEVLERKILRLDKVYYIGAALPTEIAKIFLPEVWLATLWGTTESGFMLSYETKPEDWEYLCIDLSTHGIEWVEIGPSRYEMQWVRDRSLPITRQPIFQQERERWSSGDVFAPHPTKGDHWKFVGRRDDNFSMANGQVVDPRPLESQVRKEPGVQSATMMGYGRPVCCLVLELERGVDLEEAIWPAVQRAGQGMRPIEQVQRDMVIVASSEKPMPKTFKGDVKRAALEEMYCDEIEECYTRYQE